MSPSGSRSVLDERQEHLLQQAKRHFGRSPSHLVRAPGRVNLIGEHTDYNGLPVMPMAIDRDVSIAIAPRTDALIELANTSDSFPPRRYAIEGRIPPFPAGDWGNYSKAAAQALVDYCGAEFARGADLLIDGNVPTGAGLSSSAALVVASTLALMAANELEIPYATLAEILPPAERYVGTLSGGMDQTISLLARAGSALRIDFFPLRYRPVPLPAGYALVVCHSLVHAEKSGAAKRGYNLRVVECRLAARVLGHTLDQQIFLPRLGDLRLYYPDQPLTPLSAVLEQVLPDRPLTLREIAAASGLPESELQQTLAGSGVDGPFAPLRRARHVLSEADRVDQAELRLAEGDADGFGELMNASHRSCRDDYEISAPELEELVALARAHGAVGSRLTGAGFGGCSVSLVPDAAVSPLLAAIDHDFYAPRLNDAGQITASRFVLAPVGGAEIIRL